MTTHRNDGIEKHPVVSREEWLSARTAFLAREKEFTRLRDELSRQRRGLPWVKVEKAYVFDGPRGQETLADHFDGIDVHLEHRDVTLVAASRAPLAKIEAFAYYNFSKTDPGETDREGASVFYKDASGAVFHRDSCYARGIDMLNG